MAQITGTFEKNADGFWELHIEVDAAYLNEYNPCPIIVTVDGLDMPDYGTSIQDPLYKPPLVWRYSGALRSSLVVGLDSD